LVGDGYFIGDGLREEIFGRLDISSTDLKADAPDEVGDLPVESNEVLVLEETEDAGRFDDGARDDRLRKIAIATDGDEVAKFRWGVVRGWRGLDEFKSASNELGSERGTGFGDERVPVAEEVL
jgi:hypothetical protein